MSELSSKTILIGVCGGIAAYKTAELVRLLKKAGANVQVVMTSHAMQFITPLTLHALSGNPVLSDQNDTNSQLGMDHIDGARFPDLIVIAPASANTLAKLAHGLSDNLLTTLCLATQAKIAFAPAMNRYMWENPATQKNSAQLRERGFLQWGPNEGEHACGEVGLGRLLEPVELVEKIVHFFQPKRLLGQHVLMTLGATHEPIDPIRFIGNHSSGKMGVALAESALAEGANVTLICGNIQVPLPTSPLLTILHSNTCEEMFTLVEKQVDQSDIFIGCAAVSDYRPEKCQPEKIKKHHATWQLTFVKNPDIIHAVSQRTPRPFCVGFAAETNDTLENAKKKYEEKALDMIIANTISTDNPAFACDENQVTVITKEKIHALPKLTKKKLADELIQLIIDNRD